MVRFVVKLANIKHKGPEAYLVKFKENPLCGFKIMDIFSEVTLKKNEHILKKDCFD